MGTVKQQTTKEIYMTIDTALNHQNRFIDRLKNCYSAAESYGSTHDQLIQWLNERVFGTEEWKRCPRHVREYVRGYRAALSDGLYHGALTWVHIHNGQAFQGWNEAPEECKQAMRENRGDSAHVWTKHLPAIKRFSTSGPACHFSKLTNPLTQERKTTKETI